MSKKLKILTLSNCDLNPNQGSGYVIVNFAKGLQNRGHYVDLIGPDQLFIFNRLRKAKQINLALGMLKYTLHATRHVSYDIVEFYGAEACLATTYLARSFRRRFKIVAHSNGIEPFVSESLKRYFGSATWDNKPQSWYQGKVNLPEDQAFSRADAIVTVSNFDRDYVLRKGYKLPDSTIAIDNALPSEYIGLPFSDKDRTNTVGFCGNWLARKGTSLISKDITTFLLKNSNWNFHLVGVGNFFIKSDHFPIEVLSRIIVTPFVNSKENLRDIYCTWRIAVMPSIYESFGLAAAESMACGCALVTTPVGFGASLTNQKEAIVLDTLDSPGLHNALVQLASDDSLRVFIANNGYHRVQGLTWEKSLDTIEKFYEHLVTLPI